MGGCLIVDGHELRDLRTAIPEFSAGAARLVAGYANTKVCEPPELQIRRSPRYPTWWRDTTSFRQGNLSAIGRDLDDVSHALCAKVWQHSTNELNGTEKIGRDNLVNLFVGELLGRAEKSVSSVADNHVNAPETCERAINNFANRRCVSPFEHFARERVGYRSTKSGTFPF